MASGTQPLPKKVRLSMQRAEERRDEEHMKQSDLFVANNPELTPRRQIILREELFSRNYYRPHTPPLLTSAGLEAAIATGTPPVGQPPLDLGRYQIPGWGAAEYTGECQEQYEQICALAQPPAARYTRSTASAAVPEFELDDDGAASPELRQLTADLGVQPTPVDEDDGDEFRSLPASAAAGRALRSSASSASSARPSLAVEVVQSPGIAAGSAASAAAAEPAEPQPGEPQPVEQPQPVEMLDCRHGRHSVPRSDVGMFSNGKYKKSCIVCLARVEARPSRIRKRQELIEKNKQKSIANEEAVLGDETDCSPGALVAAQDGCIAAIAARIDELLVEHPHGFDLQLYGTSIGADDPHAATPEEIEHAVIEEGKMQFSSRGNAVPSIVDSTGAVISRGEHGFGDYGGGGESVWDCGLSAVTSKVRLYAPICRCL